MKINELLIAAKSNSGLNLGQIAKDLGVSQTRLSEWKADMYKPSTNQIARLAELAGLPVVQTIAAVESAQNSDFAALWGRIVGKMKAAGVTAALTIVSSVSLTMIPAPSQAAGGNEGIRTLDEAQHPILP